MAPALGSFDLTIRGVRKNAIRQVGSVKVNRDSRAPACLGLSQRAVMLCHPQIAFSHFSGGTSCREATVLVRQVAVTLCLVLCIRHRTRPQRKTVPDDLLYTGHQTESPSDRFVFPALLSHVGERFLASDHAPANA